MIGSDLDIKPSSESRISVEAASMARRGWEMDRGMGGTHIFDCALARALDDVTQVWTTEFAEGGWRAESGEERWGSVVEGCTLSEG